MSGALMLGASLAFNAFTPNSIPSIVIPEATLLSAPNWSPQGAGALIGLTQLLSIALREQSLGMSTSLVGVCAPIAWPLVKLGIIPRDSEVACALNKALPRIIYVLGAIGGAYLSANVGSTFGTAPGLISNVPLPFASRLFSSPQMQAFIGGMFIWLGARIGGGCTSGHGISGFTYLRKTSILAVPCMFGAGIISMLLLNSLQ